VPNKVFWSSIFSIKNTNILQFDIILNKEASVVVVFFQIFGMARRYFSKKLAIPNSN